jgi:hypothetical protein
VAQGFGPLAEKGEKPRVLDDRDLERLGVPSDPFALRQRPQKIAVVSTANGGAKVPAKFLAPAAFMPFLTPTPASFCASTVVGTRTNRRPR